MTDSGYPANLVTVQPPYHPPPPAPENGEKTEEEEKKMSDEDKCCWCMFACDICTEWTSIFLSCLSR
ncbi:hypothetical protein B9Z55_020975 [Caenorhabditis nigoni]|uniref:Uncharacterized protein n=1 Tax=Caenorhabditis nigoni TaxID=1611254 RepID=A0A2G5TPZ2_9PELO|nr:hypothetical protein B9Z55_020975 [Caenorhabditis nigoni]